MVETGVVFGRFQVFHLKQMEYVLAAKSCILGLPIQILYLLRQHHH